MFRWNSNPTLFARPLDTLTYGRGYHRVATLINSDSSLIPILGPKGEVMKVSLWIRETANGKRRFGKPNKKKLYAEGTVFRLRYAADGKRRWETLGANNLNAALAARATKEVALLTEAPAAASAPAKADQRGRCHTNAALNDCCTEFVSCFGKCAAHIFLPIAGPRIGERGWKQNGPRRTDDTTL